MRERPLIYIADDEENIRCVVKSFLESEGYAVRAFPDGEQLMQAFSLEPCDLVILDVMMPRQSGFEICAALRDKSTVPIIMLTARDSDLDYATGMNLGSDDYFTKPFSAMSLVLRVKAIFRRIAYEKNADPQRSSRELSFSDLCVNNDSKSARLGSTPLELTPNEFNLLYYLIENKDRAVSRDEILDRVWGYTSDVETRAVDDTVRRLRKKIAGGRARVETVWGFGFRMKEMQHG